MLAGNLKIGANDASRKLKAEESWKRLCSGATCAYLMRSLPCREKLSKPKIATQDCNIWRALPQSNLTNTTRVNEVQKNPIRTRIQKIMKATSLFYLRLLGRNKPNPSHQILQLLPHFKYRDSLSRISASLFLKVLSTTCMLWEHCSESIALPKHPNRPPALINVQALARRVAAVLRTRAGTCSRGQQAYKSPTLVHPRLDHYNAHVKLQSSAPTVINLWKNDGLSW